MEKQKQALIIFIKNPIPGKAKTRIAKTMGIQKAHTIYLKLLEITRTHTTKVKAKKYLFYDQFLDEKDEWASDVFEKKLQSGDDLGARMKLAFQQIGKLHQEIILIGSDCPYLTSDKIESAFSLLQSKDMVIGPATDGGYYLLGMKKIHKELFENITWSSSAVFEETSKIAKEKKLNTGVLPYLTDIDTEKDWLEFLGA